MVFQNHIILLGIYTTIRQFPKNLHYTRIIINLTGEPWYGCIYILSICRLVYGSGLLKFNRLMYNYLVQISIQWQKCDPAEIN